MRTLPALVPFLTSHLLVPAALAVPMFSGLGGVPGEEEVFSRPRGISANGAVVVGYAGDLREAVIWSNGVMTILDPNATSTSQAAAASADGSRVVGGRSPEAFLWENGAFTDLGDLPGGTVNSQAEAISADGSVIAGESDSGNNFEAFRWEGGVMTGLGFLPGGVRSDVDGISGDGRVIVGTSTSPSGAAEAFRWENGVMTGLGFLEGGGFNSQALGVSFDGSVVVGLSDSTDGIQAVRWDNGVMTGLGFGGTTIGSGANAVSADGSIVVGYRRDATDSFAEAFVWDPSNGVRALREVLVAEYGLDLTGWALQEATAISADGTTIVGRGMNPAGLDEGWIAAIPEPSAGLLSLFGLVGVAALHACATKRAALRGRPILLGGSDFE